MKEFTKDYIPCWYYLSQGGEEEPSIVVGIHKDFLETGKKIPEDDPIVNSLKKEFSLETFSGSLNGKTFGFNRAFSRIGKEEGGFIKFFTKIPVIKKEDVCGFCNGTGKDKVSGGKCSDCNGKGKIPSTNFKQAYEISASFTMLFKLLGYPETPEKDTSAPFPQLMMLRTKTSAGLHGGAITGMFSPFLVKYLISQISTNKIIPEMTQAMRLCFWQMFGKCNPNDFRVYLSNDNGLKISYPGNYPGNICGISPEYTGRGKGYEFTLNIETPGEQLMFLSCLAALNKKARQEIKIPLPEFQ